LTITFLTIRQFLRSRSLLVVVAVSLLPILFALIPHVVSEPFSIRELRETMADLIFLPFTATTLLPLATLDDKTLHYLALKPVSRFRIVFEKWLAVMIVTLPIIWIGIMATWLVLSWGHIDDMADMVWPLLASALVGVLGFGSIFMLLSLFIPRALLFGVFYVFIWESTLSRFLPGIRSISISHYTRSLFVRLLDDRRIVIDGPSGTTTIVITIACIVIASLILSTWRLRTMAME
jgi:ABC-type transport system involved in multi-copper enzyme maturation permease subunit